MTLAECIKALPSHKKTLFMPIFDSHKGAKKTTNFFHLQYLGEAFKRNSTTDVYDEETPTHLEPIDEVDEETGMKLFTEEELKAFNEASLEHRDKRLKDWTEDDFKDDLETEWADHWEHTAGHISTKEIRDLRELFAIMADIDFRLTTPDETAMKGDTPPLPEQFASKLFSEAPDKYDAVCDSAIQMQARMETGAPLDPRDFSNHLKTLRVSGDFPTLHRSYRVYTDYHSINRTIETIYDITQLIGELSDQEQPVKQPLTLMQTIKIKRAILGKLSVLGEFFTNKQLSTPFKVDLLPTIDCLTTIRDAREHPFEGHTLDLEETFIMHGFSSLGINAETLIAELEHLRNTMVNLMESQFPTVSKYLTYRERCDELDAGPVAGEGLPEITRDQCTRVSSYIKEMVPDGSPGKSSCTSVKQFSPLLKDNKPLSSLQVGQLTIMRAIAEEALGNAEEELRKVNELVQNHDQSALVLITQRDELKECIAENTKAKKGLETQLTQETRNNPKLKELHKRRRELLKKQQDVTEIEVEMRKESKIAQQFLDNENALISAKELLKKFNNQISTSILAEDSDTGPVTVANQLSQKKATCIKAIEEHKRAKDNATALLHRSHYTLEHQQTRLAQLYASRTVEKDIVHIHADGEESSIATLEAIKLLTDHFDKTTAEESWRKYLQEPQRRVLSQETIDEWLATCDEGSLEHQIIQELFLPSQLVLLANAFSRHHRSGKPPQTTPLRVAIKEINFIRIFVGSNEALFTYRAEENMSVHTPPELLREPFKTLPEPAGSGSLLDRDDKILGLDDSNAIVVANAIRRLYDALEVITKDLANPEEQTRLAPYMRKLQSIRNQLIHGNGEGQRSIFNMEYLGDLIVSFIQDDLGYCIDLVECYKTREIQRERKRELTRL